MSRAAVCAFYAGRSPVVLASASPRRVALLRQVGLEFTVADPGPERGWPGRAEPRNGVRAIALDKARRVAAVRRGCVVIGADTLVVVRGIRMGKPDDARQAEAMLHRLQGRAHEVWTGIAVVRDGEARTAAECTRVRFARMTEAEIRGYVTTREPLDKAGAYAIQGRGAMFVRGVDGDYFNVVGLPLHRLRAVLAEFP